jgi:hypothetical protein
MYSFFKNIILFFVSFAFCLVILLSYAICITIYVLAYFIRTIKKTIKHKKNATKPIV